MLLTLYGYILKDVLKMLAISTIVLVIVISFGASIKPLMDGLLSAETLPTFIMLMYALPFSLAFAVTMVYTRMAADGEITACSAGGLSYASVFKPVAYVGIVMMLAMFALSNWVFPSLHKIAREMVQRDMIRIMMNEFAQGRSMRVGDSVIYAREAQRAQPPHIEGSPLQPEELLLLRDATFGKVNRETGRVISDHTASEADILVYRDEGRSWIQCRLRNPIYHTDSGDTSPAVGMQADKMEMLPTMELPGHYSDDPRRMSWSELMVTSESADNHPSLTVVRMQTAGAIADAQIRAGIMAQLEKAVQAYGKGAPGEPARSGLVLNSSRESETFILAAPSFQMERGAVVLLPQPEKPVLIDSMEKGKLARRYEASGPVVITVVQAEDTGEPKLSLSMKDVIISDARESIIATERTDLKLSRLWWPQPVMSNLMQLSGNELISLGLSFPPEEGVYGATEYLQTLVRRLQRRAVLEFHLRGAYSFNLLLAAVFAAVISVRLRGSISMVVFFYTFLVVLGGILLTYNGERFARSQPLFVGIMLLWLSSLLTAGGIGMLYARVARN